VNAVAEQEAQVDASGDEDEEGDYVLWGLMLLLWCCLMITATYRLQYSAGCVRALDCWISMDIHG
jgi:hypothetical protein